MRGRSEVTPDDLLDAASAGRQALVCFSDESWGTPPATWTGTSERP
jgi:hypothetical protein